MDEHYKECPDNDQIREWHGHFHASQCNCDSLLEHEAVVLFNRWLAFSAMNKGKNVGYAFRKWVVRELADLKLR